ncbi:MAG: hypothetical protein K9L28_07235 [Synergistales bacterium]|nr:hypothetical protein [Synergistales bacterium]
MEGKGGEIIPGRAVGWRGALLLVFLLLLAFTLRTVDYNWDQGHHLHPDERFLTMVGMDLELADSLGAYLDPGSSPMSPYNRGYDFFVYGTLPLVMVKTVAVLTGHDSYGELNLVGRAAAALADTATAFFLFLILLLFRRRYTLWPTFPYLGLFIYAIAVLPIQQSHFFTVDTFLVFFSTASLWAVFRGAMEPGGRFGALLLSCLAGGVLGAAMACKVTALYPGMLVFCLLIATYRARRTGFWLGGLFFFFFLVFLVAVLRVGDPHMFDPRYTPTLVPAVQFYENLVEVQRWSDLTVWFPPTLQWISRTPVLFALQGIVFWGFGIPCSLAAAGGFLWALWQTGERFVIYRGIRLPRRIRLTLEGNGVLLLVLVWAAAFFVWQSTRLTHIMRYFLFLYPLLAAFAALGCEWFLGLWPDRLEWLRIAAIVAVLSLWTIAFMHIYKGDHTRVAASKWIYDNVPEGSVLAEEHWDDALPLPLAEGSPGAYRIEQIPIFDRDSRRKMETMKETLLEADYYVVTSSRGYATLRRLPWLYPKMAAFYRHLFAEEVGFERVATFTSYPRIEIGDLSLVIDDDPSEESFTVFDHPKVIIFRKKGKVALPQGQ